MKVQDYYEYLAAINNLDNIDKDNREVIEDFKNEDLDLTELDLDIDDILYVDEEDEDEFEDLEEYDDIEDDDDIDEEEESDDDFEELDD